MHLPKCAVGFMIDNALYKFCLCISGLGTISTICVALYINDTQSTSTRVHACIFYSFAISLDRYKQTTFLESDYPIIARGIISFKKETKNGGMRTIYFTFGCILILSEMM